MMDDDSESSEDGDADTHRGDNDAVNIKAEKIEDEGREGEEGNETEQLGDSSGGIPAKARRDGLNGSYWSSSTTTVRTRQGTTRKQKKIRLTKHLSESGNEKAMMKKKTKRKTVQRVQKAPMQQRSHPLLPPQ